MQPAGLITGIIFYGIFFFTCTKSHNFQGQREGQKGTLIINNIIESGELKLTIVSFLILFTECSCHIFQGA